MPHVEILGIDSLDDCCVRFQPRSFEEEGRIAKTLQCYLSCDRRSALIECVTVEGFLRQSFFVLLSLRSDGVMVRLLPRTAPEKTDAVKRCLVWIARGLAAGRPTASVGATNLPAELETPLPEGADFA